MLQPIRASGMLTGAGKRVYLSEQQHTHCWPVERRKHIYVHALLENSAPVSGWSGAWLAERVHSALIAQISVSCRAIHHVIKDLEPYKDFRVTNLASRASCQ